MDAEVDSPSGCPYVPKNATMVFYNTTARAVTIVSYSLVSLLAVAGNAIVIFLVVHFPRLKSTTNYFIANLAVADMLIGLVCIPFTYWHVLLLQHFPFGWVMCSVIMYWQALSVMLSAHTLVVISLDRFVAILFPLRHYLTPRTALTIVGVLWVIDVCLCAPIAVVTRLEARDPNDTNTVYDCLEKWPEEWPDSAFYFSQAILVLQYFFPLLVIIVTYSVIGIHLFTVQTPGESTERARKAKRDSMKKLILMMFIVSTFYTICWLPLNAITILWTKCASFLEHPYVLYIFGACHFVAMAHSCVNPFIYYLTSERFRDGFHFVFRRCLCRDDDPQQYLRRKSTHNPVNFVVQKMSEKRSVAQFTDKFLSHSRPIHSPAQQSLKLRPATTQQGHTNGCSDHSLIRSDNLVKKSNTTDGLLDITQDPLMEGSEV